MTEIKVAELGSTKNQTVAPKGVITPEAIGDTPIAVINGVKIYPADDAATEQGYKRR